MDSSPFISTLQSRTRSFLVRLGSTVVLIGAFAGIIYLGHVPLAVMILGIQVRELSLFFLSVPILILSLLSPLFLRLSSLSRLSAPLFPQILMVRELYALADTSPSFGSPPTSAPASRALRWYLFAVATFWIYTRFCRRQLAVEAVAVGGGGSSPGVARVLGWLVRRHNLAAFMLYTAGE